MSNKYFDDHVKKSFEDFEPPVPDHIWGNISKEKDRRKPAAIWWLFSPKSILLLSLFIVSGAAFTWFSLNKLQENKIASANQLEEILPKQQQTTIPLISASPSSAEETHEYPIDKSNANIPAKQAKIIYSSSSTSGKLIAGNISFKGNIPIDDFAEPAGNDQLFFLSAVRYPAAFYKRDLNLPGLVLKNHPPLPIPCPSLEKNTSGNKKYLEFYAGPDYAKSIYTDTANSSYRKLREESTQFIFGFSAGIRYTKVFSNSMSVRTGINYSQVNERFTYKQGDIVQIVYIINNNGDTTGSYSVKGTRYKKSTNIFRTIDIPLLVGYEMGNENWHVNLNAGPIVNLRSFQQGNVVDTANNPVDISSGSKNSPYSFKKNIGIGFNAGASVYYKINDRLHLMAEPYFRFNPSQVNTPGITLKQKYNTAGIRLGIRLDIP